MVESICVCCNRLIRNTTLIPLPSKVVGYDGRFRGRIRILPHSLYPQKQIILNFPDNQLAYLLLEP